MFEHTTKSGVVLVLLSLTSQVQSSPIALPAPQAVTAQISPITPPRAGSTGDVPGNFGIVVMDVSISTSRATGSAGAARTPSRPPTVLDRLAVSRSVLFFFVDVVVFLHGGTVGTACPLITGLMPDEHDAAAQSS
ncbi:hypothetical protein PV08_01915 [Exophiala spinifera]|uniref:Secreted protein n=1 Tax=Exophiala spinifera TaxID=91928 RepID=A0A0D2BSC4_9EURO|nr:uncharacterized protein PV08_01915 [Exophiala spinifera]KIW21335.1 hypothetical protein PV08_01915 [Exophiala spinifera]